MSTSDPTIPKRRSWLRRILWLLAGLIGLYVATMLADYLWFRNTVPIGFRDANWSGTWTTHEYGGLSGRLLVRLPEPIPEGAEFKAEALVYYPIYSVWKTGRFVKMDFVGRFDADAPSAAGKSANLIPGGGNMKFKGVAGNQIVEYAALVNDSRTKVVGGYRSEAPYDLGHFFIRYY